ncbi:MAG: HAMP domain-containing sensor histidine kinase [Rhizomicrobium sp.]|nr:HAMP domain-containing sensor histidine kinase [Rhizomicrobium sp.]
MTGGDRQERVLAGKLDLLFRGHVAVPGNMLVALVVAVLLRQSHPIWFLVCWMIATVSVGIARLFLHRAFQKAASSQRCNSCWAVRFTIGTFASGMIWGTLCGSLIVWHSAASYVLLTFVCAGMTAGALATFAPYMPAYLAYATPFILPLSVVSLLSKDDVVAANGALVLLYFVVVTLICRYSSRFVNHTVKLQVDNEILRENLRSTRRERNRARTEKWSTLAQLSHELRTPLNAIMGFSEAMREEVMGPLGNRRYKEYASHIHTSGSRLLNLTNELMLLSQGESGTLTLREESVDVAEIIVALCAHKTEAAAKAGLHLSTRIADNLPHLNADRDKLRRMLRNLVDNAIKFSPAGGAITLAACCDKTGALVLSVQDTGIGIESDDIEQALQPFGRVATALTNNESGAGLGLPICQRLAELHGAKLAIASTRGEGTTVSISFPMERSLAIPQAIAAVA